MMLVDNFRIILLVGLICAAGLRSTDAAAANCFKGTASEACNADKPKCKSDSTGMVGCVAETDCAATTEEMYCCVEDDCNDMGTKKNEICKVAKKVKDCGVKCTRRKKGLLKLQMTCKGEGVTMCKADSTGARGCATADECTTNPEIYCCKEDYCNDMGDPAKMKTICASPAAKTMKQCPSYAATPKSTASGMFDTYYGGIPPLTLVSASMYYIH